MYNIFETKREEKEIMSDFSELAEPKKAMLENFAELNKHAQEQSVLRLCEVADYASDLSAALLSLLQMDVAPPDALLLLKDSAKTLFSELFEMPSCEYAQRHEILWQARRLSFADSALLAKLFLERLVSKGVRLREEDFVLTEDVLPIYAYVKNAFADEAYEVITENLPDARVCYVNSFAEGARLLLSGEVGYCLFPIEENGDMRLPTVEGLLTVHKLCIQRILPVFGLDGLAELKYALVSRGVHVEPYQKDDDRYFEFHLEISDDSPELSDLLSAIALFGLSLFRIHTVAYEGDVQTGSSYTLVVRSQGEDFLPLIVYLALFFESYRIIGIYKNLES